MSKKEPIVRHSHRIVSVFVENLFGLYTYDIRVGDPSGGPGPTLLVLYGDNGTGKTTILQLVYHLLGKEDNRGHRTYLARIPFRQLRVTLDPPITVEAYRRDPDLVGSYRLRISRGNTVVEAEVIVESDLTVRSPAKGTPAERQMWNSMLQGIATLDLTFFFLTADRRSDQPQDTEVLMPPEGLEPEVIVRDTLAWRRRREREGVDLRLEETVERLEKWIRDEALKGTHLGEASSHTVYADIAKRIAQTRRPGRPRKAEADQLVKALVALESRSKPYACLGLISAPHLGEIVVALENSAAATRQLIANVVSPYVESLRARLDALQEIQELITLLLERINAFFRNKTVTYELARGLVIATPQGKPLPPSQLSSGERQLLGLLAQVVVARKAATVFLIDEPEISLNVKWQRVLVDTLLQLVRGNDVQFILATHSLELLATHREHVHRLEAAAKNDDRAN